VARNVARGRRTREPVERQRRDALEPDEFLSLLDAAAQLDNQRHKPHTLARAREVRALRDAGMRWNDIAARLEVAPTTAMYLSNCEENDLSVVGPRRAVIATLGLAGLRVSELCERDNQDIDLTKARIRVGDAKTPAGVRFVDIRPRLLDELSAYRTARPASSLTSTSSTRRSLC
jgi:integrase